MSAWTLVGLIYGFVGFVRIFALVLSRKLAWALCNLFIWNFEVLSWMTLFWIMHAIVCGVAF
jgi:hypothetical protein